MSATDLLNRFDVSGRVALVTGGRRGLGLAMAVELAQAGACVAVAARSAEHDELRQAMERAGAEWTYIRADLSRRAERAKVIPRVLKRFGRLDILVNGAGIQHRQPAMEFSLQKWDEILSLMLTAVFELSQQAAVVMVKQGGGPFDRALRQAQGHEQRRMAQGRPSGGKIINIASLASFQGGWTVPAYAAAKHGVAGLTRALANEWAARNINVNAIAPGYFDTEMCAGIKNDPVREPKIRERIPAGRWGKPDDLVGALLFLASDASAYVHGHVLVVDGGWLGR